VTPLALALWLALLASVVPGNATAIAPAPAAAPPANAPVAAAPTDTGSPRVEVKHADNAEYNGLTRHIILTGAVYIVRGTMTMRADQIDILLSEDEKEVQTATATGRVEVIDGRRRARANHALFDQKTGDVILTGLPHLWDGPNDIEADRIIYNTQTRLMRAEGRVRALFLPAQRGQ